MDIRKDISDAIEKNMPSAVGEELQKLLEQAKKDALDVVTLKAMVAQWKLQAEGLMAENQSLREKLMEHAAIDKRTEVVAERERNLTVRELQQELAAEKRISAHGLDITSRLVRNTEYRSTSMGNMPVAIPASPPGTGGNSYGSPATALSMPTGDVKTNEAT